MLPGHFAEGVLQTLSPSYHGSLHRLALVEEDILKKVLSEKKVYDRTFRGPDSPYVKYFNDYDTDNLKSFTTVRQRTGSAWKRVALSHRGVTQAILKKEAPADFDAAALLLVARDIKVKLGHAEVAEADRLDKLRIAPVLRVVGYSKLASEMAEYVSEELEDLENKEDPDDDRIMELDGVHSYFEDAVINPLFVASEVVRAALDSDDEEERPKKKKKGASGNEGDDFEGDDFGEELASALEGCGDDIP